LSPPDPDGFDVDLDDAGRAIADSVAKSCAEALPEEAARAEAAAFDAARFRARWRALGEQGVLALATPEGDGGARELVAALEALGAAAFPGPLPASVLAAQVLDGAERRRVTDGEWIVSLGSPSLLPFAPLADLFLVPDGEARVRRAAAVGDVAPVSTLGGEPWGRVELALGEEVAGPERCADAWALHDTALAARLAATGRALTEGAADHARARRQFGRPIGDFQAVAHPLADALMGLDAARALARAAACAWDDRAADRRARAALARLSAARAALAAAHTGHQVFGALGITLEGPAFRLSRRIRQEASERADDTARAAVLAHVGLAPEAP